MIAPKLLGRAVAMWRAVLPAAQPGAIEAARATSDARMALEAAQATVHRVPPLRREPAQRRDDVALTALTPGGDVALSALAPGGDEGRGAALGTAAVSRQDVRLVVVDGPAPRLERFAALPQLLRAGDLVVVNDAATLPGSLRGHTVRGDAFELRLSGPVEAGRLSGVLLGAGDHRTRTEHRPPPPWVERGDRVTIAGMAATVATTAGRRVELVVRNDEDALWRAVYASGVPVQYAHRPTPLPLWEVQTAYAGRPWAAEMPSAGRPLTWDVILGLRRAGIGLASLTHAAGLSSTGDDALDRALPWPERYEIPRRTAEAIAATRAAGGRVIAIGTSVVRALEAAALETELSARSRTASEPRRPATAPAADQTGSERSPRLAVPVEPIAGPIIDPIIRPGSGIATLRLDARYRPRVVAGLVSGLHVPGESHFELLSAFAATERLERALALAVAHGLSSHELGDACLIVPA